jgi:hypothetical protein
MCRRLTRTEYERKVVDTLRHDLMESGRDIRHEGNRITVGEVRLERSGAVAMVAIMFREESRPGCMFGWRFPATEADSDSIDPYTERPSSWEEGLRGAEQAEIWGGTIVLTNFVEQIEAVDLGLPPECDPDGVTWVGDY